MMTAQTPNQTPATAQQEQKPNNTEFNFRQLEAKYEKQLAQERAAREQAEKLAREAMNKKPQQVEEEDQDDEPYVDHKKLSKTLAKFEEKSNKQTQNEIQSAVQIALKEERKKNWMNQNPDFFDVMQHAEKFAQLDPELAETILEMPEGFERQKLVYKNIKALGLHKPPEEKKTSIQDKVDANRRSPFYQPSSVGSPPYASQGDFSAAGQQQAYQKMQDLKKKLRLG